MIHFVLGGARSGKSRFAEQQTLHFAKDNNCQPVYIATATAIDDEMTNRIDKHQNDRLNKGGNWQLIECPINLTELLNSLEKSHLLQRTSQVYLLDCLTLWLNNQLYSQHREEIKWQQQYLNRVMDAFLNSLDALSIDIVIVSNEVGLGVIPMGESTRLYVDYCGWLNQRVAAIADKVTLVTAGIPLMIKPSIKL